MQEEQFVQIQKHIDPFYEVVEDRGAGCGLHFCRWNVWLFQVLGDFIVVKKQKLMKVMNIFNRKLNHFLLLGGSLQCWRLCAGLTG